jgi:RNA ligase
LKSKKTFDSDVAKQAMKLITSPGYEGYVRFCSMLMANDETAIFEYTAPDARIVLSYDKPQLKLLHVRDNATGAYWVGPYLRSYAEMYGVEVVDEVKEFFDAPAEDAYSNAQRFNINRMLEAAETREGIEGWVIQFEGGEMVKLKTKWYMERHRTMTFLRERDIAEMVLNESLDDVKAMLVGDGVDITEILKIESDVITEIRWLEAEIEATYEPDKKLSQKDFAIKHKGHKLFGLLMSKYVGKEPDVKGFFEKTCSRINLVCAS